MRFTGTNDGIAGSLLVGPAPRFHRNVDSTGLRLCGAGDWSAGTHATKRRRSWRKLHLVTDFDTGHIIASVLTGKGADYGCKVCPPWTPGVWPDCVT